MKADEPPPTVVEATRVPRTSAHHGLLTRIKHPRAHRGPARHAAAGAAALGALLAVLATVGAWPALDDCLLAVHARGTPEHAALHADDKHSQVVFILLLHATYVGLIFATWVQSSGSDDGGRVGGAAGRVGRIACFWVVDAVATYAWRVALYLYVVRPLGLGITGTNCGTSKVISGHTHFYCFHMLQLGYILVGDSRPFLPPAPKKPALALGDSGDPRFMAWLIRTCVKLYAIVVMLWTVGTLQQTYMLGFHSLRHMIAGFAAACLTFALFVRVLDCLALRCIVLFCFDFASSAFFGVG